MGPREMRVARVLLLPSMMMMMQLAPVAKVPAYRG